MDTDTQNSTQPYTILRIKRKRNEEPLDALVVESGIRRKKSRGGMGVFKFAQTVEDEAWNDQKLHQRIQDEVSRLSREEPILATEPKQPIVAPPASSPVKDEATLPVNPPKIISTKDLPPKQGNPNFRMFDAVPETDESSHAMDREMEKIMPMLKAYLNIDDAAASEPAPESGDYVWDVFYHRPSTLSEWNDAATVGTLTGLPPSLTDPYDSDSDSEAEDEADEDSNAEEYYKNDYPDEEELSDWSGSGDEFHEHSDHEQYYSYDSD
ncbi:hypothetical protein EDD18DRAFT_1346313 [Armillaria luteobubalina]|uniref:Probable RNA polymerase II nuclear localization protein SLC7A6OS n=1 Tax=Armillaria luteobubalina TaxID=153913 RepID=A0AA39QKP4_9AGAR|nr:hypothetical protein EDD18DRAFT_1346313 [Armillaria luteobubalina]